MVVKESFDIPYKGIFWYIDGQLIALKDKVNPIDPFEMTDLLHKEAWKTLRDDFKVNEKVVPFDYFPRGRVETLVIQDIDGNLDHYEANIYLDRCISKQSIIDKVIDEFNLGLKSAVVNNEGQLFIDGSHYTCHNCTK